MALGDIIYTFAVYKFFWIAIAVFAFGVAYRIARMIFYWRRPVKADARKRPLSKLIIEFPKTFIVPIIFAAKNRKEEFLFGLMLLHIIGVLPILFLLSQHVAVWSYYLPIYRVVAQLGLWIPESYSSSAPSVSSLLPPGFDGSVFRESIWGPLTVILNGDVLAVLAMIGIVAKMILRIADSIRGVRGLKLSDMFNYLLLLGILLTGFLAARYGIGSAEVPTVNTATYRLLLGLHVLLAEILLMWIPFSKYWHFVFGYWYGEIHKYWDVKVRKGVV
ncbi:hypothetical protein [Hyperthermus butylicus]|uniref:Nitrate reductase gamma subunit n=1 Tax=Hyperthermus butylicus (strain DSM 5456 / JCM 9403 / PLM1-5) TaxID=415426 RepID=A2BMI4_HYPBU|nr:hypothetical protein [Hyperthermus butylicus]ABM81195.1 hypothetical protein Hbut_1370 [Hyperthermus butylicus DSM 5456]